ncbi:MAG: ABC transporter substrate-binding protein [Chloroflexota bacterium]|nr:ABC transporter substrate-binding protein [Chloroflexota bacterium]
MSRFRLCLASALVALSALVAWACVAPAATPTPIATPTPTAAPTPTLTPTPAPTATPTPPLFPMTMTDSLGRKSTIATAPRRIVSLAPSNTEVLFAVGAGDLVVGVTKFCNYPAEARAREQVGGFSAKTISVEKVVSLKPDLVFSAGKIQQPVIEALEQAGIPVVSLDANSFNEVYANIELVGRVTGRQQEAARVVGEMKERVAQVQKKAAGVPKEKRLAVFYEVWDEPLMTAGPGTFIGQMIDLAGGVSVFSDVTESWPQVSAEEVVKRNPAVILGPDTHGDKLTPEKVAQRSGWSRIGAVSSGRIYLLNGDIISRAGPRLADGLEAVAKALYPELFP